MDHTDDYTDIATKLSVEQDDPTITADYLRELDSRTEAEWVKSERNDIHRPSEIIPSDYQEVAVWTMNIQGIGDAQFILREREIIREHMARTQGTYAHIQTSGSCQVCGNVQAIYLVLFYHEKSNTYIRVGFDCTTKLGMSADQGRLNLFRKNVANAREAQAGKRKAIAILSDLGLMEAWDIFLEAYPVHSDNCAARGTDQHGDDNGVFHSCNCGVDSRAREFDRYEERTIRDIVGKLVRYGSVSEKASGFVRSLLNRIQQRPIVEAKRQAEKDAAGPVPVGRVKMTGEVVGMKEVEGQTFHYGDTGIRTKLIIKLENGSKVYGNRFNNLTKGDTVTFVATVEASKDDPKFGFYKRATVPARELSKDEKKSVAKLRRVLKTIPYSYAREEWGAEGQNAFYDSHRVLEEIIGNIKNGVEVTL